MHTIANINDQETTDDDTIVEEIDHNQDWGEQSIATKKLDIIEIVQQMTIKICAPIDKKTRYVNV